MTNYTKKMEAEIYLMENTDSSWKVTSDIRSISPLVDGHRVSDDIPFRTLAESEAFKRIVKAYELSQKYNLSLSLSITILTIKSRKHG